MLDPASILAAISAANGAYATLKTCATNANEAWKCAAKFLEAKTQVDVQAEQDKASGKTNTEAFLAHIDLKRKQKELDEFIAYSCEGWVIAEWNAHKKRLLDEAHAEKVEQRIKNPKPQKNTSRKLWFVFTFLALTAVAMFTYLWVKIAEKIG